MIKILNILLCATVLYGCSTRSADIKDDMDSVSQTSTAVSASADTTPASTLILASRKFLEDYASSTLPGEATVSPLPFGPSITDATDICEQSEFYRSLIGEGLDDGQPRYTLTYRLPAIDKMVYRVLDANYENAICNNDSSVNQYFGINHYRYRLPDVGANRVYYMTNRARVSKDFPEAFEQNCANRITDFYGYLIVHNTKTRSASALAVYYEAYVDSYQTRQFLIEKDYTIRICHTGYSEGPNGADKDSGPSYTVTISDEGNFIVGKTAD